MTRKTRYIVGTFVGWIVSGVVIYMFFKSWLYVVFCVAAIMLIDLWMYKKDIEKK